LSARLPSSRAFPRRLAALGVSACAAGVLGLSASRAAASVERSAATLPADGTASMTLSVRTLVPMTSRATVSFSQGGSLVRASCGQGGGRASCTLIAGVAPGEVKGRLKVTDALGTLADEPFSLRLAADAADTDSDGFPDAAELSTEEDREAFRRWFAAIAAAQYYRPDDAWAAVHRDCAGLLRFAYKEALKAHDSAWRARRGYLPDASMPDVKKYRYPNVPVLGERLFRVAAGRYTGQTDVAAAFSPTATAKWLLAENVVPIPEARAGVGDLLFFEDPEAPGMAFHSMVYLADLEAVPGERDWVVYHTGPDHRSDGQVLPGTVRKVRLSQLLEHPDEKWRPRADNPHFLGFYRWKIAD
jgi:uncharacterized protein YfaT (DUF1175 family)